MDLAAGGTRLTIGGTNTVWYYRNAPAVAQKIEPVGKYDGCYLPRRIHVTGNIDIHELAWDKEGELWVVNTCGRLPHPGSKWVLRGQAARPTRTIATVPVRSRRFCRYCVSPASL
jgi:hypothetical protein